MPMVFLHVVPSLEESFVRHDGPIAALAAVQ